MTPRISARWRRTRQIGNPCRIAGGAADAGRRHRWRQVSGGDQHSAGVARATRADGADFIDIAMTDAMFTFGWAALAIGAATGKFPKSGEMWLVGGFAALSALSGQGRSAGRLRRPSKRNFGFRPSLRRSNFSRAECRQRRSRSESDPRDAVASGHRARERPTMAANLCRRRLLHDHRGCCRSNRRCDVRILSSAGYSRIGWRCNPARRCRRCRSRSRRNFARRPE